MFTRWLQTLSVWLRVSCTFLNFTQWTRNLFGGAQKAFIRGLASTLSSVRGVCTFNNRVKEPFSLVDPGTTSSITAEVDLRFFAVNICLWAERSYRVRWWLWVCGSELFPITQVSFTLLISAALNLMNMFPSSGLHVHVASLSRYEAMKPKLNAISAGILPVSRFFKIFIALLFVIISLHKNNNMTNQFYFCFLGVFILCSSDQLWAGK